MIVLDLEFNSGMYDNENLEEILQIGAVRVDALGGSAAGVFNAFIKPRVHKRLSPAARVLPELDASMETGVPFEDAYAAFLDFCGDETEFAEWGRDDFRILGRNAVYFGLRPLLPEGFADVQTAFMRTLGAEKATQLYQAAEYCRVPDSFVFHNALNDAMYTNLVGGFVPRTILAECVYTLTEEDVRPVVKPAKPAKGQTRMGPFSGTEPALNNKGCRRAVCPVCRKVGRVGEWYTTDGRLYYAEYRCPGHGPVLRRLRLAEDREGRVWAYLDAPRPTRENLARLRAAQKNDPFLCHTARSPSYIRHRGRKKKKK